MGQTEQRETILNRITSVIAGGVLAFACCTLVLLAGTALISSGKLGEDRMTLFCILGAFLGCFVGGCYAAIREGRKALIFAAGVSVVFFLAWLTIGTALYDAATPGRAIPLLAASLVGAVPAGFAGAARKKGGTKRK